MPVFITTATTLYLILPGLFYCIFSDMANCKKSTRHSTASKLVPAEDLPTTDLPTVKDALAKMKFEREKMVINTTKKIIGVKEIDEKVLPDIKYIL